MIYHTLFLDVVTIIFAAQWISEQAYRNVFEVLKPGGMLLINVYPPDPSRAELLVSVLESVGFVNLKFEDVVAEKYQYLVIAEKPIDQDVV